MDLKRLNFFMVNGFKFMVSFVSSLVHEFFFRTRSRTRARPRLFSIFDYEDDSKNRNP